MATILLVEDEPDIRYVLSERLAGWFPAARIVVAESAEAGLELVTRTRPSVIVLDLTLRGLDGFGFARRVRELAGPIPMIVVTGDDSAESRGRAMREGFTAYLLKPELDDLPRLIAPLLGSGDAPR